MEKRINPILYFKLVFFLFALLSIAGCKKESTLVDVPSQAHFTGIKFDTYIINSPSDIKRIPIGLTNVSDKDRTITFTVTSPTGAVAGTHYTITEGNSIVIPAGKVLDSITVVGVYNQYVTGRRDSLVFTITDGDEVHASTYNPTLTLLVGPCSESDTKLTALLGEYKNTNEDLGGFAYGPYTTSISLVTHLTPTTGTVGVGNIWNAPASGYDPWKPITFTLDWTDPLNTKVTLVQQSGIGDAGSLNPAYDGMDITVRPYPGETGTFSYCQNKLVLKMQIGVTGLGFIPDLYTVFLAR